MKKPSSQNFFLLKSRRAGNIVYPTDIGLTCGAFGKMRQFAENNGIPLWFDDGRVKKLRREYNMNRDKSRIPAYFSEFAGLFSEAFRIPINPY